MTTWLFVPVPSAGEAERDPAGFLPGRCSSGHVSGPRWEGKPVTEARGVRSGKGFRRCAPQEGWGPEPSPVRRKGPKFQETQSRWLVSTWLGLHPPHPPRLSASWQRSRASHVPGLTDSPDHGFPSFASFSCQTQLGKEDPAHSRRTSIPGCLGITRPFWAIGHPRLMLVPSLGSRRRGSPSQAPCPSDPPAPAAAGCVRLWATSECAEG